MSVWRCILLLPQEYELSAHDVESAQAAAKELASRFPSIDRYEPKVAEISGSPYHVRKFAEANAPKPKEPEPPEGPKLRA